MRSFSRLEALVAPLDRANVDTDAILSKQFMKSVRRTGYADHLFDQWRYLDHGEFGMDNALRPRDPQFPLNQARYAGAAILLTRQNFGCGSSREHAAWALWDYGFRALVAPDFADIFYQNCLKNGILPITLDPTRIDDLFRQCEGESGLRLLIDLESQTLTLPDSEVIRFAFDPERKRRLLLGLDDIALTLQRAARIREYERHRSALEPWLFPERTSLHPAQHK